MPDINVNKLSEALNTKADIDLNNTGVFSTSGGLVNLTSSTPADAIGKEVTTADFIKSDIQSNLLNYTTNRILEIPQDIHCDIVDNGIIESKTHRALKILKGTRIWFPQGFEADGTTRKFNSRILQEDAIVPGQFYSNDKMIEQVFAVFGEDGSITFESQARVGSNVSSGPTAPTEFLVDAALWYDTSENFIKYTKDSGKTWIHASFPLLEGSPISTVASTTNKFGWLSGVKTRFNGLGYIGSTIFALPGIKCLVGNGRNPDGSCITKIEESTKVTTYTINVNRQNNKIVLYNGKLNVRGSLWFDEQVNMCYNNADAISAYQPTAILGTFSTETTSPWNIKEFNPLGVDSLANSNASNFSKAGESYLSSLSMPSNKYINLTLGATGATYTAPANGWFTINKHSTPGKLAAFENESAGRVTWIVQLSAETDCRVSCPARTGDIVRLWYSADGNLNFFRFIYAEGNQ